MHSVLSAIFTAAALAAFLLPAGQAQAQQRQVIAGHFTPADFESMRWLEGSWRGTGPGEAPFYERYQLVNDTLLQITYYSDSTFQQQTGTGTVYRSNRQIYHQSGNAIWKASSLGPAMVHFEPHARARNAFSWKHLSYDRWKAIMRQPGAPVTQPEKEYLMTRVNR